MVAGTKIPNYCVISETAATAREIERQGEVRYYIGYNNTTSGLEGMRILISEASMKLIMKVGGFRCELRGVLDIKVYSLNILYVLNFHFADQRIYGDILACRP